MNAFAAMEGEERQQQQRRLQQHEAWSAMFTGHNNSTHSNDVNDNANANHASVLKSTVSPLQTFLRRQGGQQQQQQILVGGTLGDKNDVTSRAWNPFHHDDEDNYDDDEEDDDEDCPLPIDSDHITDVGDIRDAVDIALAQIGGDGCCDDSLIDLDDVEEFFADIEEDSSANVQATIGLGHGHEDKFAIGNNKEEERPGFNDYYSSAAEANYDSMTSIEFAPLAGPTGVVDHHHQQQQQQQQFHPVSIIEGMEVLTDGSSTCVPQPNNNNMDYSSRNMGDSGRGSLASLGSLTGAFSKLNQCMQHTAQTREMIQQLSSPNLQNDDDVFDNDSINHNNSCSSLPMPNLSFHSLPSAGRSNRGRPTKSLTRLTKTDLLGRSSSLRSLGSANSGGVRKASTKATLKSSSTTSLRSMGSSSSSKRRSSSHLRGQRYTKKRSSCSSLSTMKSDENPLVTGIAPINWDGI